MTGLEWAVLFGSITVIVVMLWCIAEATILMNRDQRRTRKAPRHCRCSKHIKEVQ